MEWASAENFHQRCFAQAELLMSKVLADYPSLLLQSDSQAIPRDAASVKTIHSMFINAALFLDDDLTQEWLSWKGPTKDCLKKIESYLNVAMSSYSFVGLSKELLTKMLSNENKYDDTQSLA